MQAGVNVFEMYGYHFSRGKREGLVFPLCYAEMLTDDGTEEGELAVAIMSDNERRFGFFDFQKDRFMDMHFLPDPDVEGSLLIERDFKGKPVRLKPDQEKECIIGVEFEPSSQLVKLTDRKGMMSMHDLVKQAADLLENARYKDGLRKKGRDIPAKSVAGMS